MFKSWVLQCSEGGLALPEIAPGLPFAEGACFTELTGVRSFPVRLPAVNILCITKEDDKD